MSLEDAREAIYSRVVKEAEHAAPDDLVKLAEATSKVAFGACGADTIYRYEADIHQTNHPGETRRSPAGYQHPSQ